MSNSSIWLIDRTLSGATTPSLSGLGSNGKEWVLRIPQNSSLTIRDAIDVLYIPLRKDWPTLRKKIHEIKFLSDKEPFS